MEEGMSSVAFLPDDIVLEILARLPARSLCVCMCVSRSWHRLVSDPANRGRLKQPMSGLLFSRYADYLKDRIHHFFVGLSSPPPPPVDPGFSYLPSSYRDIELLDSSNGLFLLRCSLTPEPVLPPQSRQPCFYVVCNPTTEEWVRLPQPRHAPGLPCYDDGLMTNNHGLTTSAALGFDPAVSSQFHVFQLVEKQVPYKLELEAVDIYSSETGNWVLSRPRFEFDDGCEWLGFAGSTTYLNGFLHVTIRNDRVASVDTTGQTWRVTTVVAGTDDYFASRNVVGHSRGRLLCMHDAIRGDALTIYALHDDNKEWILKQKLSKLALFGPKAARDLEKYAVAAIHPDRDSILFCDKRRKRLMSYNMKYTHVRIICTHKQVPNGDFNFVPYVPLYSGVLASSKVVK